MRQLHYVHAFVHGLKVFSTHGWIPIHHASREHQPGIYMQSQVAYATWLN